MRLPRMVLLMCAIFGTLTTNANASITVSGVVTDTDGLAVEGARITFANESDTSIHYSDVTDGDGIYHIEPPVPTAVEEETVSSTPETFQLFQNYPNPFNPSTIIPYQLGETGHVRLSVYNMLGQPVRTLANQVQPGGLYAAEWNGRDDEGGGVAAGLYIVRMETAQSVLSKKAVLLDGMRGTAAVSGGLPASKITAPSQDRVDLYTVTITGDDIEPFSRDGVSVQGNTTLDFQVVRIAVDEPAPDSPPTEVTIIPSEELAVWGLDRSTLSFDGPNGVAVDADGFIYTTEFRGNRIRKLSPDGELILEWGSTGSIDARFQAPTGIFIGPDGNVYVSESGNHRIQKFTAEGDWLASFGERGEGDGQFLSAMVLAVSDGGEIFASDWGNSRINVFDLDGNPLRTLASGGRGDGELINPTGIKIGPDGNLWVVDRGNHRVQVLTQEGEFVKGFGAFGDGPGEFNSPTSIAFDDAGRVYISEFRGNRIQVFDLEHNYRGDLIPGVLTGPHGLVFDANGDLIVTDTGNNVIRKLRVLGG